MWDLALAYIFAGIVVAELVDDAATAQSPGVARAGIDADIDEDRAAASG
jgi:hypothetical protein